MPKKKTGRPKIQIDFNNVKKLCALQCTAQEIADFNDCSVDTLDRRLREEYKLGFADFFKKHNSGGKISLRRNQFKLSEKNATMAIWLGKQYLGQSDTPANVERNQITQITFL